MISCILHDIGVVINILHPVSYKFRKPMSTSSLCGLVLILKFSKYILVTFIKHALKGEAEGTLL